MNRLHTYKAKIEWTGNTGSGTASYQSYERSFQLHIEGKPPLSGSSDPAFRGDHSKYNPEELFLAAISSCHMLWYLHLCSAEGIVVTQYSDSPTGTMLENEDGGGHFTEVVLHPKVTIAEASKTDLAQSLHHRANELCFIANSLNFKVKHQAIIYA